MMQVKPFFIKVITPLHAGSGSDLGIVDMPIQRESHTGFPKIEASSLKGSIRNEFAQENGEQEAEKIFGTGDEAGKLGFSDAKILFFPVKSAKGVFAYITCPMVLERLEKDFQINDKSFNLLEKIKIPNLNDKSCITFSSKNTIKRDRDFYVVLEEYSFKSVKKINLDEDNFFLPAYSKEILDRLVIVSDDNFTHFVKNSTEVVTRIKISNETGTVDKKAGALFTEEYLPSETIMYAMVIGEVKKFTIDASKVLQLGGNTTLGKGIVELSIYIKKQEEQKDG